MQRVFNAKGRETRQEKEWQLTFSLAAAAVARLLTSILPFLPAGPPIPIPDTDPVVDAVEALPVYPNPYCDCADEGLWIAAAVVLDESAVEVDWSDSEELVCGMGI